MRYLVTLIFLLLSLSLYSQTVSVSGYIRDVGSNEVLHGVNVYSFEQKRGTTTDKVGYYRLYLPVGDIDLTFSYVGYVTQELKISLTRDTIIDISMTQNNLLEDVIIYASRKDFRSSSSQISAIEVPIAQVKNVPALFGEIDVMKVLQLLPGVQSGGDGNAGIYVRGGNYDQNMISLDGSTLYNVDHLKGFVSALNADVISNIILYKGGFPARYGGRLSSIVDIGIKEGNYEGYHAALTIGTLSSRIHIEGPIIKGKNSFNIAARLSYFDLIAYPALEKISDNSGTLSSFANMNYYDVNAKMTHKFSARDKLSAVFYLGKDVADTTPTNSEQEGETSYDTTSYHNIRSNSTENSWGNLVSSLYWTRIIDDKLTSNLNLSYSQYRYRVKMSSSVENNIFNSSGNLAYSHSENSWASYNSGISDIAITSDFNYLPSTSHNIRFGGKFSYQHLAPMVDVYKYTFKRWLLNSDDYYSEENTISNTLGNSKNLTIFALYGEDDFSLRKSIKINLGLRYTLFGVKEKMYHSLEPRLSGRFLLSNNFAFKTSFSMMQQGIHLLSSSNLVMPSDIWVPITNKFKPMKSYQLAAGFSYEPAGGVDFSVEGYYKKMDNILEYMEGTSYMTATGSWEEMVVTGKGWSYGAEFFIQKKRGETTGWISYTWSKSLRQFDRSGETINGGEVFYANNDYRHNLSITLSHRFGRAFELSGTFALRSGKRGVIATDVMYGGMLDEYDPYTIVSHWLSGNPEITISPDASSSMDDGIAYIRKYTRLYTYSERNEFQLPLYHRLDIGLNWFIFHERGKSTINLSISNLYNRQNISNVYIGYQNSKAVLKGICLFPFLPSLSYTYHF